MKICPYCGHSPCSCGMSVTEVEIEESEAL